MAVVACKSEDRSVKIDVNEMPINMQDYAIAVAKRAFDLHEMFGDIATYITENFDERYGRSWHCVVGRGFGLSVRHDHGCYISFYVEDIKMILWKSG